MATIKEIEIRSEEVQDILSYVPHWLTQWGSTLFSILIVLLVFLAWIIKYPERIAGRITLTTQNAPIEIVNQVNGTIKTLVNDQDEVKTGDQLAVIESPSEFENIKYLANLVTRIESISPNPVQLPTLPKTSFVFGEIQGDYISLIQEYQAYQLFLQNKFYKQKLVVLKNQVQSYNQLIAILEKQAGFQQKELLNVKERFHLQQGLYLNKVISKQDFLEEENTYYRKQKEVEQINKDFVELKITKAVTEGQIYELINEHEKRDDEFRSSISKSILSIHNYINSWEKNHILIAPFDGKISFISNWRESQYVKAGDELFTAIPVSKNYIVNMFVSAYGFGKIMKDNKVLIKLDDYPYQEYGHIIGHVTSISLISHERQIFNNQNSVAKSENQYRVVISLDNSLKTTFNKSIILKPYMSGTAEIITKDMNILQRVIMNFN